MLGPYNLPHLTFQQQAQKLASAGYLVSDMAAAEGWLGRIGYYRLQPYWLALVDNHGSRLPTASLSDAVDLYRFDSRLRAITAVGLERLEVALRVQVSHAIGRRDVIGHRKLAALDPAKQHQHQDWLARADSQLSECREAWLTEFSRSYSGDVPTWMAVEAWSFGTVSKLFAIMHRNDKSAIAKRFVTNGETFTSWMRACATVRNYCAHHNRLWNKPLIDQPSVPKGWEAKSVQHISGSRLSETRVYAVLAIIAYCLDQTNSSGAWKAGLKSVAASFPSQTGLRLENAGFPHNWANEPLWIT